MSSTRAHRRPSEDRSRTAGTVASENPRLYYEIQHMNPYNGEALEYLLQAVTEVKSTAERDEMSEFAVLMNKGKEYFGGK